VLDIIEPNVLYRSFSELLCHYFVFRLANDKAKICIIGPYLSGSVDGNTLENIYSRSETAKAKADVLKEYYSHLTVIENDSFFLPLINAFCETMWGGYNNFILKDISNHIEDIIDEDSERDPSLEAESSLIRMTNLAERYQLENELMEAVSKGEVHRSEMLFQRFVSIQSEEARTSDLVRNVKNYTIVLNTILRKAAEQGKVHPIHLDKASSQIASRIEECKSYADVISLSKEMVRKYALLVRNHSMSSYSSLIQQTLMIINLDLATELTLNVIAGKLHVNASYLSSQFKKELGVTLTDYITQKRINHAIFLINSSNYSISAIAQQCGIPDVQYFSKIFKKQLNMSPSQYRKMVLGK